MSTAADRTTVRPAALVKARSAHTGEIVAALPPTHSSAHEECLTFDLTESMRLNLFSIGMFGSAALDPEPLEQTGDVTNHAATASDLRR